MKPGNRTHSSGITVTGSGSASVPVDQATLTLGVELVRPDAGEAFRAAGATVTRVLAILADDGVEARSVRTSTLSLGPQYDYRDNAQQLVGYRAAQQLIVTLTELTTLDRLVTNVATRAGNGVRIDGLELTGGDQDGALTQAREAAYQDAEAKGLQLAELAGRALGPLVQVVENDAPGLHPARAVAFSSRAADDMPVATGDTIVQVSLAVHWHFAD